MITWEMKQVEPSSKTPYRLDSVVHVYNLRTKEDERRNTANLRPAWVVERASVYKQQQQTNMNRLYLFSTSSGKTMCNFLW